MPQNIKVLVLFWTVFLICLDAEKHAGDIKNYRAKAVAQWVGIPLATTTHATRGSVHQWTRDVYNLEQSF